MAHGNKKMPLDKYPYMDNDLKSRESGYVTHEELADALNAVSSALERRIENIENELLLKIKPLELIDIGDFEIINSVYAEFGNVVFIGMKVKLLSDLTNNKISTIGIINYENGYKKPLFFTGWSGLSTVGLLLMNSGKLKIKAITPPGSLHAGEEITFSLTYIGEDVINNG